MLCVCVFYKRLLLRCSLFLLCARISGRYARMLAIRVLIDTYATRRVLVRQSCAKKHLCAETHRATQVVMRA